jgi:hypothetical protein
VDNYPPLPKTLPPPPPRASAVRVELDAISEIAHVLERIDDYAKARVLKWLWDWYVVRLRPIQRPDALDALEGHLRESCDPGSGAGTRG